ncbi:carbohydrate ABC transporter permease [Taklimakanibacter deserti]|uniref:carbohydrate ABC transporter permease n=1 Tax=Taklimakanibacter deserti TaxID=2267839 RepID=UPI000E65449A
MKLRRLAGTIGFYGLMALIVFYAVFPFYWAIVSSLKSGSAIFRVELIPSTASLENYRALFVEQPFARNILNSLIVASVATLVSLTLASLAAYALGRMKFRGRSSVLFAVLSISMFPQIAVLSGLFELIRSFGLYNSLMGLVFSYLILLLPFATWVLTTFMRELPRELEEMAALDGASALRTLTEIFLPLMAPALAASGLLAFILAWNEFLFALTFTLSNEQRTVPVAIALITGASAYELPWGRIMAASVIVTVPLILLVLILQRHIVSGLVAGAVKG